MQIINLRNTLHNFDYEWPKDIESFDNGVEYDAISATGSCVVKIGYCWRQAYGRNRRRVLVWIDDYPYAEFIAADDFNISGEVLSEIRFYDKESQSKKMCRYGQDSVPQRYAVFRCDSMKRRISGERVHDAWAVVANISDNYTMAALAAMRKYEIE